MCVGWSGEAAPLTPRRGKETEERGALGSWEEASCGGTWWGTWWGTWVGRVVWTAVVGARVCVVGTRLDTTGAERGAELVGGAVEAVETAVSLRGTRRRRARGHELEGAASFASTATASLEVAVLPAPHPRSARAPSSPVLGRRNVGFSRICRASSRTRTRRSSRATGGTRGASRCSRRASCRRATPTCACSRRRSSSRSTSRPVTDTRPPFLDIAPSGGSATAAHVAAPPRDMR